MGDIGIIGNGSQADEVESYLNNDTHLVFRAVTAEFMKNDSKLIDIDNPDIDLDIFVIVAVGAPGARKSLVEKWKGKKYLSVISNRADIHKSCIVGNGSLVSPGAILTTNIDVGEHVLINIGVTISHNCKIGDYTTISPGVNIAGNVEIGEGVFIGIGAIISNNVKIASGCVIGAGTVVLEDITAENSVVVGVPGKVIKVNEGWLSEI